MLNPTLKTNLEPRWPVKSNLELHWPYFVCQPLLMWYLCRGVLCIHDMTKNTLVHICNTLNGTCCIEFRIHSRFHQVYRQFGAGGRLIAITIILHFLMCHRYLQLGDIICTTVGSCLATHTVDSTLPEVGGKLHDYTLPGDIFWWNTCRWSVPYKSLYSLPLKAMGASLLDSAISFWPAPSDDRIDAYLRKNWQDVSFVIAAKLFRCVYHKKIWHVHITYVYRYICRKLAGLVIYLNGIEVL